MKTSFRASTLVEAIVAALVLMIAFNIAMGTLAQLPAQDGKPEEWVEALSAVREYYRTAGGKEENGVLEFNWGKIEVGVTPYRRELRQITLTVIPDHGSYRPVFVYLR